MRPFYSLKANSFLALLEKKRANITSVSERSRFLSKGRRGINDKGFQTLKYYLFKQEITNKEENFIAVRILFKFDKKGITLMPKIHGIMKCKAFDIDIFTHLTDALTLSASNS